MDSFFVWKISADFCIINKMNVSKNVSEKVVKEMDYLLREKERHEEERFRRLDTYIRQQQNFRREAAKSPTRKLRRLLGATEYI